MKLFLKAQTTWSCIWRGSYHLFKVKGTTMLCTSISLINLPINNHKRIVRLGNCTICTENFPYKRFNWSELIHQASKKNRFIRKTQWHSQFGHFIHYYFNVLHALPKLFATLLYTHVLCTAYSTINKFHRPSEFSAAPASHGYMVERCNHLQSFSARVSLSSRLIN